MSTLYKLISVLEKYCGELELVSFGLAPNPNGFCYEVYGDIPNKDLKRINSLLDQLTIKELKDAWKLIK